MNVFEFFLMYGDWWLACGFIFSATALIDDNITMDFWTHLIVICAPPVYVLFIINWKIGRSK